MSTGVKVEVIVIWGYTSEKCLLLMQGAGGNMREQACMPIQTAASETATNHNAERRRTETGIEQFQGLGPCVLNTVNVVMACFYAAIVSVIAARARSTLIMQRSRRAILACKPRSVASRMALHKRDLGVAKALRDVGRTSLLLRGPDLKWRRTSDECPEDEFKAAAMQCF